MGGWGWELLLKAALGGTWIAVLAAYLLAAERSATDWAIGGRRPGWDGWHGLIRPLIAWFPGRRLAGAESLEDEIESPPSRRPAAGSLRAAASSLACVAVICLWLPFGPPTARASEGIGSRLPNVFAETDLLWFIAAASGWLWIAGPASARPAERGLKVCPYPETDPARHVLVLVMLLAGVLTWVGTPSFVGTVAAQSSRQLWGAAVDPVGVLIVLVVLVPAALEAALPDGVLAPATADGEPLDVATKAPGGPRVLAVVVGAHALAVVYLGGWTVPGFSHAATAHSLSQRLLGMFVLQLKVIALCGGWCALHGFWPRFRRAAAWKPWDALVIPLLSLSFAAGELSHLADRQWEALVRGSTSWGLVLAGVGWVWFSGRAQRQAATEAS